LLLNFIVDGTSFAKIHLDMKVRWIRFLLLAVLLIAQTGLAAPYGEKGKAISFTQPDGSVIDLRVFGDEFYAATETLDGYTVVFDPVARAYVYASLSVDGSTLLPTGQPAGKSIPKTLNVSRHLRINVAERKNQAKERFRRWDAGMGVSARWESIKAGRRAIDATAAEAEATTDVTANDTVVMAPPSFTTTGIKVGLTLLIDFDDDPATVPQADIQAFCNSTNYSGYGNNGSVRQYFLDNSNGQLNYTNVVTVYIRIPNSLHPKSWYNDTSKDAGDQANLLIRDAITIMTNLPNYTTTILPALNNLTVDGNDQAIACNVFYAGGNGGVWSYGLWPHSWSLYNVGAQSLSLGGKKIFKYQVTDIGSSLELGTFCHENGHMLCGYPDIYDYDYDSIGGAGYFCLMNSGGHGDNPVQICAYLKRAAGWGTTIDLNASSSLTASVSSSGANFNRFYRYVKPGVATEYYLVENRQPTGRDADLPAGGVAIWHIDELGDKDDQRMLPNSSHENYEVTLVQADNLWHFQNYVNSGDSKDLYYSGNTAAGYANQFSDDTAPHANWWDGTPSGVNFLDFSASGTTMTFTVEEAPSISIAPTHIILEAASGFVDNTALVISNSGGSDLTFNIMDGLSSSSYTWLDSGDVGGPAYSWIDISGLGSVVSLADDGESSMLNIGFDFPFYDVDYTQFQIGANGAVSFSSGALNYDHAALPSSGAPSQGLLVFWDDLNPASVGSIRYHGTAERLVVSWLGVPFYDTTDYETFQVVLYPDGRIRYQYNDLNGTLSGCTVGLQDDNSNGPYVQVAYNESYLKDALTVEFTLLEPSSSWLTYSPTNGTVAPNASTSVWLTGSASNLTDGVYTTQLTVACNDLVTPEIQIPVEFTVLTPDADSDGLPDWWETQYFAGATNADASATCSNGVNTILEAYVAGLDPINPASVFVMTQLGSDAGDIDRAVLQWNLVPNRLYTIYWTSNLLNGFPVAPLASNISAGAFTDTVHGALNDGFYRIEIDLAP